jgi:hypothetical protein
LVDKCHRITTSCETVSFLFRHETPALWRTSVTGLPLLVRLSLFCLDRRLPPYGGQVSQDYHSCETVSFCLDRRPSPYGGQVSQDYHSCVTVSFCLDRRPSPYG